MSDQQIENSFDARTENEIICRARILGASGLVECLMKNSSCHWKMPFGEGWLCAHLFNKRIAKGLRADGRLPAISHEDKPGPRMDTAVQSTLTGMITAPVENDELTQPDGNGEKSQSRPPAYPW
jgi:hypothetical protein